MLDVVMSGEGAEHDVLGLAFLPLPDPHIKVVAPDAAARQMHVEYVGEAALRWGRRVGSRGTGASRMCSRPPPTMVWKIASWRCVTASTSTTCRMARSP